MSKVKILRRLSERDGCDFETNNQKKSGINRDVFDGKASTVLEAMDTYAEQFLLRFLEIDFISQLPVGSYSNKDIVDLYKKENP